MSEVWENIATDVDTLLAEMLEVLIPSLEIMQDEVNPFRREMELDENPNIS